MNKRLFILILFYMFSVGYIFAQEPFEVDSNVLQEEQSTESQGKKKMDLKRIEGVEKVRPDESHQRMNKIQHRIKEVSVPKEGYVTLEFREAGIKNVLKILSYKSGVNRCPLGTGFGCNFVNSRVWL